MLKTGDRLVRVTLHVGSTIRRTVKGKQGTILHASFCFSSPKDSSSEPEGERDELVHASYAFTVKGQARRT